MWAVIITLDSYTFLSGYETPTNHEPELVEFNYRHASGGFPGNDTIANNRKLAEPLLNTLGLHKFM